MIKDPTISGFIKDHQIDRYIKKINTAQCQAKGLLYISGSLKNDTFSSQLGLESISASQLSRRMCELSLELAWELFGVVKIEALKGSKPATLGRISRLFIIDSTIITMCLNRYHWASYSSTKGGVKLHLRIIFQGDIACPDTAMCTTAKVADKRQMDDLIVDTKGAINVYDRGYVDYQKIGDFCDTGVLFTTRFKNKAFIQIFQEHNLDPCCSVNRDCTIILGKGDKQVKGPLRLIETVDDDGEPIVILSNTHHLTAQEIAGTDGR